MNHKYSYQISDAFENKDIDINQAKDADEMVKYDLITF